MTTIEKCLFFSRTGPAAREAPRERRGRSDRKKERPEGGASKRSVQGLACKSENNSKIIIALFSRKCKPRTVGKGVTLP